jgi:heterodisulfide reductase subunit B2
LWKLLVCFRDQSPRQALSFRRDVMEKQLEEPFTINSNLANLIEEELGQNIYLCYQCVKCSSGCPLSEFFDYQPNQIMRAIQLGIEEIALDSKTPWMCAFCQTCTTRCPQGLDIAAIMEYLTREAVKTGRKPAVPEVDHFNKAFMREIHLWGRAYEVGLMLELKLRTKNLLGDMDLGVKMLRKNKLPFLPKKTFKPRRIKPVPGAADSIAYYPGCSLHSTATEFDHSTRAVAEALGVNLIEPKGWGCCGSSAAHRVDLEEALSLPFENLIRIEQSGFREVTMPCAACFNRHKAAQYSIKEDPAYSKKNKGSDGYIFQNTVHISNIAEALENHVGVEKIKNAVSKPLEGLKVVCYYGCLMTRPPEVTGSLHPENPMELDHLMGAVGAEVVDWSYKTVCCGAAHSLTRPDIVLKLSHDLIDHAKQSGADMIVVACPLCHTNLDARQFQMKLGEPMPVVYFTQLMAIALGLPTKSAALHKNLVDPVPVLREKNLLNTP